MIYTCRNFISTFYFRWTFDDIYILQLISTFLHTNTWWYIHDATLYLLFCRWTRGDIYIPQRYINFPVDEHVKIYANCNFILTWDIHTATLYQLSCRWTRDEIYIPRLYFNFPADEHVMIYTYCNFISTFPSMNTWRYMQTAFLY